MDSNSRARLDDRIKNFFIAQVRKECGEDFKLIEHRVEAYLQSSNLKEAMNIARAEINLLKYKR